MADNKIVTIDRDNLVIDANTGEYVFRYRVVSEDKNRTSAWSPLYRLPAPTIDQILFNNNLIDSNGQRLVDAPVYTTRTATTPNGDATIFNIFWNAPDILNSNERRIYDLYIKWGTFNSATGLIEYDGDYEYTKRVNATSVNYVKPESKSSYDRISIKVQSETYPKQILDAQLLYSLEDQVF